ncbi:DNA-binding protein [Flagellimonas flava]|uniref:Adhesin domain-containing protein n=1 Tax=Flagellimonas flava TaxID=570519 RepID=A0A1M5HRR7_9FLAO|nr:DNA-binding protein [Allomuricauda flava]SHG18627.1 hypothetical protein SAMN04488116_0154 [Allomuricauda flava]
MNRNHLILCNVVLLVLAVCVGQAQEKTKTYTETFNVNDQTVLNIDTSHADIEFETWAKDEVEITAEVELEGATDEEAKDFFEKDVIKILGNSKEIQVRTGSASYGVFAAGSHPGDFQFVVPEMPAIEPLFEELEIPELPEVMIIPELPPLPPIPFTEFDYDAYKKDGDKYLKEWKKDFDKNFDKNYQKKIEEWGEKMEQRSKEREQERAELLQQRDELRQQREEAREQARAVREEAREAREEARAEMREKRDEVRRTHSTTRTFSIHSDDDSNIFYFSSDGEQKQYKVKKRIKIKMPKSVKLKMNVRHGEVKLAANTKNLNASLSYASLLASTIDGDRTNIRASYSPVVVQKWNYGQLKTDYSDRVDLREVKELRLNSVSSQVTIDRLEDKVFVTNNLGALQINSVADGFSNIDITVENGEVDFKIPSVPFSIYVNETTSNFEYPKVLAIGSSKNYNTNVHKGYHISNKTDKAININSKYSEVVLKE